MARTRFFLSLIFLLWVFPSPLRAIEADSSNHSKKRNRLRFIALPTIGSAPETGFYFGAVALLDIIPRADSIPRNSVIKTELTYTAKRQFIAGFEWTLTSQNKTWILFGNNYWTKFPELFWGIGGDTPQNREVRYGADRLELANSLYRKVHSNWYLGICQRFQNIYKPEYPQFSDRTEPVYNQLDFGISSGIGLGLLFDTRTNILNPRPGEAFLSVQTLGFGKATGGDFSFLSSDLDFRYYQKLTKRSLLAFQFIGQMRTAGTPFRMMAMVGGPIMLRGYYQGRFRDNQLLASQMEWRWTFHRYFGMTAFGGIGNVYNFDFPNRAGSLKSAAGLGLRVIADPKGNSFLRMDFALTREENFGFYISFGEAF